MLDVEIGLVLGEKLNFDQFFLRFNVKKKIYAKRIFYRTFSIWLEILNTRHASLLNFQFIATIIPTFIFTLAFLSEKDKNFIRCKAYSVKHTSLTFTWVKIMQNTWNE